MKNKAVIKTRRQVLKALGAAGAITTAGAPFRTLFAATPALDELRAAMGERLVLPADPGYDGARRVWNAMIDRRPAAIARCASTEDVVRAVKLARGAGLPLSVRGGGHNVAGKAVRDDALMIDLGPMHAVDVNPDSRKARVGGGARWAAFDAATARHGLVTTGGTVSTTGVGGLTLGGGLGWLMRKHGLSCDNLVGAEVVTANGDVLYASAAENPDLFWALRGGGGNFGIVTGFEFGLHAAEPVVAGLAMYPQAMLRDMLSFYRDYTAEAPNAVTAQAGVMAGPPGSPLEGQNIGWIGVCHKGPLEEGLSLVKPIKAFGPPAIDGIGEMQYLALQSMFDGGMAATSRNYWRSNFMADLPDEVIDLFVRHAEEGLPSAGVLLLLEHLGGAIAAVGENATAFSSRGANYNSSVLSSWTDATDDDENIAWTRSFGDELKEFATGAAYVNYMTGDEGAERLRSTYETNLEQLIEVKRKYDPDNVFSGNQNIAP
jgi:FAD/FMN-containing dehydrogenase